VKNRNNDRSDASLQVNHPGGVHGSRSKSPSSHQGGYHKNVYISPGSGSLVGDKKISPWCIIKKKQEFLKKASAERTDRSEYDNPGVYKVQSPYFFIAI